MRILFTFVAGLGHLEPLLPVARAARAAGHTVAFGCGPSMVASVAEAGFGVFAMSRERPATPARLPLLPLDRERESRQLRDRFARRAARHRVPLAIALFRAWRPDVVVCDETDFGALLAAEQLEIPYATALVIASGSFVRADVVGEALDELRAQHGLPPDPGLETPSRYLVLSPFPPSVRDPACPLPATAYSFRPSLPGPGSDPAPQWASDLSDAPAVYFTLGTIFNLESGDLLVRVIAALRELPINLVATVGHDVDPAELGPQPGNVRIERYVPQSRVLPYCDLVVSHGGSGSVIGALAHGLPSLLLPIGADQPWNAERCLDLGVARVLDPVAATPESLRQAVVTLLDEPTYRTNAERIRDEIAALPDVANTVVLLERIAAEKQSL